MPPLRYLAVVAAFGIVACSSDSPPAVTMALGRTFSALNLGTDVTVELDVTCGDTTTTARQTVALTDTETQVLMFPGLPVCGGATLTVRVLAAADDGGAPVLAFEASQTSALEANVTVSLDFTGPALGEIVVAPSIPSVCAIPDGHGGTVSVAVTEPYHVSLPVGAYSVTCASDSAPDVTVSATTTIGKRVSVSLVFTPIDAAVALTTLTVDGTQLPDFAQQKDLFAIAFDYTKSVVTVSATAQSAVATVVITSGTQTGSPGTGTATLSLQLVVGTNEVVVTVTNGAATHAYTVRVRRGGPRVSNVSFAGADSIDPPFDVNNAGPYTVYYSATLEPLVQLVCDPDCTLVPVHVDGANASVVQDFVFASFAPGAHGVVVNSTKADGTSVDYQFNVLRGALSNITCNVGALTPVFDPATLTYDVLLTETTGNITCAPTAIAPATALPVTLDLAIGDLVFPITSQTRAGQPIDQYNIHIIHQLLICDYDAETDQFEVGNVVTGAGGRKAVVLTPNLGSPIRDSARFAGSNTIYFLQSDGSDSAFISTRTLDSSGKLNPRAFTATPDTSYPPDYQIGVPTVASGLVTHPSAKVLYTYGSDGSFYRVPLTALYQDAPNQGQPGLPGSVDSLGATAISDGGNGSRLFMKADGTALLWFGFGAIGLNFEAASLDATTGDYGSATVQQTLAPAVSDVAYGASGDVFLTSYAGGLQPYTARGAPVVLNEASILGGPTSQSRVIAHPTRPIFYAWTADQVFTLGYDVTTGDTSQVGNAASSAETVIAIAIEQRGQIFAIITDSGGACSLSTGTFDGAGRVDTWGGATAVDCAVSALQFVNFRVGASAAD